MMGRSRCKFLLIKVDAFSLLTLSNSWSNKERLKNMRKAYQDKIKQNGATGGSSRSSINGWRPNTDNQEVS